MCMIIDISNKVFGKENRSYLMGISIIWIVFFHIYLWSKISEIETTWWIDLFDKGALGVDMFLLLSAYGLQASIERNSLGTFYRNRIKRMFPLYIYFLLTVFLTFERHCPIDRIMLQCLCQVTGLSLFMYPDFFSCGFCFDWFTPAILLVYTVFPIISKFVQWMKRKGIIYELITIALCVVVGVWIRENKHFPFGLLAIRFPIIYLGVTAYIHIKDREVQQLLLLVVITACMGLLSGNEEMRISLLLPPLLTTFAIVTFNKPFIKCISYVGQYSYEVYLAHIFPVAFFIPLKLTDSMSLIVAVTIASTVVLTIFYAYLQKMFLIRFTQS